jgi:hypothetical protein
MGEKKGGHKFQKNTRSIGFKKLKAHSYGLWVFVFEVLTLST